MDDQSEQIGPEKIEETNGGAMLPLDLEPREVAFRDRGRAYVHRFPRITAAHWEKFFSGMLIESEREGNALIETVDVRTPALELYRAACLGASGYVVAGGGEIITLPKWQERIPYAHRLQAVDCLQRVSVHEFSDDALPAIDPEHEVVTLDAAWGVALDGAMNQYSGLVHRFAPPTSEHWIRFNRQATRARVIGGSRTGRTQYPVRQKILLGLYDELVRAVEGYSVAGQPLVAAGNIQREMDAWHKVAAIGQLFRSGVEDEDSKESA